MQNTHILLLGRGVGLWLGKERLVGQDLVGRTLNLSAE